MDFRVGKKRFSRSRSLDFSDAPIESSLDGAYTIAANGSLLVHTPAAINAHRFRCAIDYPASAARWERARTRLCLANHILCCRHSRQLRANTSASAEVESPQFTFTPRDRSYREGASVTLNCEVLGRPRPMIRWLRAGRPLERSRKHELHADNTRLVIYPFLEHDVGK